MREVGAPRRGAAAAVRPPLQLVSRRCGGRRRLGESEWRWPWRASAAASGVRGGVRALRRRLGLMRPHRDGVVRLVDELDLLELVQRRVPRRGFEARSHGREEVLERLLGGRHLCSTAGVADTPLQRLAVAGAPRVGDGLRLDGLRLAQPPPHARDGVLQRIIDQDHPAAVVRPVVVRLATGAQQAVSWSCFCNRRNGEVFRGAFLDVCSLYITPVRRFVMRLDQSIVDVVLRRFTNDVVAISAVRGWRLPRRSGEGFDTPFSFGLADLRRRHPGAHSSAPASG